MAKHFISYRREDALQVTGRLYDRLQAKFGKGHIYRDIDNIPSGAKFMEHIRAAIAKCDSVIVVIGPTWLRPQLFDPADPVRIELETAIEHGKPILPVLLDYVRLPACEALPHTIRSLCQRNAFRLSSGKDFEHHVAQLVLALKAISEETDNGNAAAWRAAKSSFAGGVLAGVLTSAGVPAGLAFAVYCSVKFYANRKFWFEE